MLFQYLKKRRRLKCEAAGHPVTESREITYYEWPSNWGVADRVKATQTSCKCGYEGDEQEVSRRHIDSLTMAASDWDDLKEYGRLDAD